MVAVIVNGEPITTFDIEQRTKLIQLSTHKTPSRQEVLDELIDEKLKIQLLKRYSIDGIDKDVDNAFANMARRMRATPKQFTEQLAQGRRDARARSSRASGPRSSGARSSAAGSRAASSSATRTSWRSSRASKPDERGDRRLRLHAAPDPVRRAARIAAGRVRGARKEAEALRARFQSCEEGIAFARALARRRGARRRWSRARPTCRRRCAKSSTRPRSAS